MQSFELLFFEIIKAKSQGIELKYGCFVEVYNYLYVFLHNKCCCNCLL